MTTREYAAIAAYYGTRTAERSGVPLIQHVDEGLFVLERIGASDAAKRAFCLHPLLQADAELAANHRRLAEFTDDAYVVMLAIEYRNIANATLSTREIKAAAEIALSPIPEVNAMLVADKIQNYKDFILHHRATHPRSDALDRYFRRWLERLGVSKETREELFSALAARR